MTLRQHFMRTALTGAVLLAAYPAAAQTSSVNRQIDSLQSQIQQLQQQLQSLQGQVNQAQQNAAQAQATAAQAQAQAQPKANGAIVTMSPGNRPGICTSDGQNCIELTSRLQLDFANYLNVHPQFSTGPHSLTSGVNARRARIGVLGKFAGDWNYALIADFGGSSDGAQQSNIENAYVTYNGFRPVAIDLGYIDVPWTLDESTSSNDIMFLERTEIGNVVTNLASGDNRAAFGARSNDDRYWAGAYLTGPTSGAQHTGSNQQQLAGVARATYQALQGPDYSLHAGVDGEYVFSPRADGSSSSSTADTVAFSDRPELRVDPTAFLNTGNIPAKNAAAVGAELAGGWQSLFFQGEYYHVFVDQAGLSATAPKPELNFDGFYTEASWTITGESRKYIPTTGAYSAIVPNHPLSLKNGGWGAFELAARYAYIDLNDHDKPGVSPLVTGGVFGGRVQGITLGVNWYPVRNIRFMLNYIHNVVNKLPVTTALGGTSGGGVTIDAIAMRAQVAF
ncbi:MAG TPA: porin [Stellaceae bacterium]|nr:porin [Stellaceae bacterium]